MTDWPRFYRNGIEELEGDNFAPSAKADTVDFEVLTEKNLLDLKGE